MNALRTNAIAITAVLALVGLAGELHAADSNTVVQYRITIRIQQIDGKLSEKYDIYRTMDEEDAIEMLAMFELGLDKAPDMVHELLEIPTGFVITDVWIREVNVPKITIPDDPWGKK